MAKAPTVAVVEEDTEKLDALADGLVEVVKDGERSFVHPTTVEAHSAVGWRQPK